MCGGRGSCICTWEVLKLLVMHTDYVYRWTDDLREHQEVVKKEYTAWLEDMHNLINTNEKLV